MTFAPNGASDSVIARFKIGTPACPGAMMCTPRQGFLGPGSSGARSSAARAPAALQTTSTNAGTLAMLSRRLMSFLLEQCGRVGGENALGRVVVEVQKYACHGRIGDEQR